MFREDPAISVVLPNLNGGKHLQGAIDSFLGQEYLNKELIIVDGRSDDDSHAIIQAACRQSVDIHWVRTVDAGLSDAFILGFEASRGELIGFLGGDDRLVPGVFRRMADLSKLIDYDAVWFNSYTWHVQEKRCILRKPPTQEMTRANLLAHGTLVGWQNIYYRRHCYEKHQPLRSNQFSMDYELLLRWTAMEDILFVYCDEVATVNLFDTGIFGGANMSSDRDGRQYAESCVVAAHYSDGITVPVFR